MAFPGDQQRAGAVGGDGLLATAPTPRGRSERTSDRRYGSPSARNTGAFGLRDPRPCGDRGPGGHLPRVLVDAQRHEQFAPPLLHPRPAGPLLGRPASRQLAPEDGVAGRQRPSTLPAAASHQPWKTFTDVEFATAEWIDWHNHQRLHSVLDHSTPAEYKTAYPHHRTHADRPVSA
ncbi:IS3 family transposase [Peterkaempfera sp. SMS 1(5)a]|uniref:IS3 family transposase n=1 Tax=Peterkaempfera podocarpi TaxID=3232308 RepID=UPI00366C2018